MKRLRKTKVVATIGPACDSPETLREMIEAGMNVARLNFSHDTPADHKTRLERVRRAAEEVGANVAIMVDTKGIEIRSGLVQGGSVELNRGDRFVLYNDGRTGDAAGVSVTHLRLYEEVEVDDPILLDDGAIELIVESAREGHIQTRVTRGGVLRNRKGVNLPNTELALVGPGPENPEDLIFAAENDVDYIAASFVQSPDDVVKIRQILAERGASIPIIAKIENKAGVANLDAIVEMADGTMVARGDLGVELPVEEVPLIQKKIIRTTVMNGKPVITATQMLDSMERNPRPTRAEVSDVANAIFDGTSAVMLSGETAAGRHPAESVRTMVALAIKAEASLRDYGYLQKIRPHSAHVVTEAVSQAAITMADHLNAAAIVTLTETGFTSRSISKYRPTAPILAITTSVPVVRKLAMNWGVTAVLYTGESSDDAKVEFAVRRARELGWLAPGQVLVVTAGTSQQAGSTNLIRVVTVGS